MAAVPIRARYHGLRGRKRPPVYVFRSPSYRSIVARRAFDHKTMSKEYVYANSRQMYIYIPSLDSDERLCIVYMPFGSSVRLRIVTLSRSKTNGLFPRPAHRQHVALARKTSKVWMSDGRRRPPAARRDRQGKADAILWRRFRSGTVIYHRRRG